MSDFKNFFNCRCMTYHNQKTTGAWLMSGEVYYHMNIIHQLEPAGLNRISYEITDLDLWFKSDLEKGQVKVIRRRSRQLYHFRNHYKRTK